MGYDSRDLNILDEMIQEKAKVSLTGDYDKKQVILKETHGANYSVKILIFLNVQHEKNVIKACTIALRIC